MDLLGPPDTLRPRASRVDRGSRGPNTLRTHQFLENRSFGRRCHGTPEGFHGD